MEGKYIDIKDLSRHQVMELDACVRCGECVKWCPVYAHDSRELITPREKFRLFRKIIGSQNSLRRKFINPDRFPGKILCQKLPTEEEIKHASESLYECSTCRQCHFVCPSKIDTVELYEALRKSLINSGIPHIPRHEPMVASIKAYDNPWVQPRAYRERWTKTALKEGRIKKIPKIINLPKALKDL